MPDRRPEDERGAPPGGERDPRARKMRGLPPLDPEWQPSDLATRLRARFGEPLASHPRDRLWFPHLLIRGATGDTGERPLWEPTPCWASPDIHLLPEGAPVDLAMAVQSPRVGSRYSVAVHIWNLGRFPAHGVTVRAWWVEPGFFAGTTDPRYRPHFIGGVFTELGDRDSGQAHRIVIIPQPWRVQDQPQLHACLLAVVESFADPWSGSLAANADRHVAQRNLTLVRGTQDVAPLLRLLDEKTDRETPIGLRLGGLRPAPLAGAARRGQASRPKPAAGRGPLELGESRHLGTLRRTGAAWTWALPGQRARRLRGDGLVDTLPRLLGARGTTARELLAGKELRSAASGALHLTTGASGYTIGLAR